LPVYKKQTVEAINFRVDVLSRYFMVVATDLASSQIEVALFFYLKLS